jgi:S-adenosylmethionine:tRNA ribosyltransferase-isomerase
MPDAPGEAASDFDFELPPERIALRPAERRDAARLMCLDRRTGAVAHKTFADLPGCLAPGDLVVLNDTRVFPARIGAVKARTGGRVELLFLQQEEAPGAWRAMARGSLKEGDALIIDGEPDGDLKATVAGAPEAGFVTLQVEGDPAAHLERHGHVPLPPYIRRPDDVRDRTDYQTVFARETGSVAAPTAGLHFTEGTLKALEAQGVRVARLTLHVGPGTFLPLRGERLEEHALHAERYSIPEGTAEAVARARASGGRVIASGTTVTRALEAAARPDGAVLPGAGSTDLFIRPGHRFAVVDGLITNFHLPRSSLLVLVAAFAGRERVLAAYGEAVRAGYRFFSYGDAMLVL